MDSVYIIGYHWNSLNFPEDSKRWQQVKHMEAVLLIGVQASGKSVF